jgi:hypothetical protein
MDRAESQDLREMSPHHLVGPRLSVISLKLESSIGKREVSDDGLKEKANYSALASWRHGISALLRRIPIIARDQAK